MKRFFRFLILQFLLFFPLLLHSRSTLSEFPVIQTDSTVITYVHSAGSGNIAVQVEIPETPRYEAGAPVVVEVSTWFVPGNGFHHVNDTKQIGAVTVSYMWPERVDPASGARSEGTYDYGGPVSLVVMKDVIQFASGQKNDIHGNTIQDYVSYPVLTSNVGLFASSHAGVVGTNMLAYHGSELPNVKYFIGRENPTRDEMYPLEIGHFTDNRKPVRNPFFNENNYTIDTVDVDYSTVGWYKPHPDTMGRPYFAAKDTIPQHVLHPTICPKLHHKRAYSRAITRALLDNGAFTLNNWPSDLLTPNEADSLWHFRIAVHNYSRIPTQLPNLKVMLVFSRDDHVQAARTKPHIRQAYDGFRKTASLWVRMNPDRAYLKTIDPGYGAAFPDNDANDEPGDWKYIRDWGFPADHGIRQKVWLASAAEMADRVHYSDWNDNLSQAYHPVFNDTAETSISERIDNQPMSWSLAPCYPNPFNGGAVVRCQGSEVSLIKIAVYDLTGRQIDLLANGMIEPGLNQFYWDASGFTSGTYFFVMEVGEQRMVQKGLLMK